MQFLNPLFFIGFLAVAIPIAVHLFNFRRYKKVYFSDISKLEELTGQTKRRSQIKQLLILAARVLAIVFLVLAFARPCIPPKDGKAVSGTNLIAVYIDNSFSMESGTPTGTLLDNAKQKAREIAAGYAPSDKFMLITNDLNGSQFRHVSTEDFVGLIDEIETSPNSQTLSKVAKRIFAALANSNIANRTAYFITDFQKSTADLDKFPKDTLSHAYLVPLKGFAQNNIFIDSLSFNAPAFTVGNTVNINVFIRNSGNEDVENIPVKLLVNGKERAIASTDIAENSESIVKLRFTIDDDRIMNGKVSIADHPITFDDDMFFSINPLSKVEIVSVNGAYDNQYIRQLFGNDSMLHIQSCKAATATYSDFAKCNLIILNEVVSFHSGLNTALYDFAQKGGTALVLPAKDMDVVSFNRFAEKAHLPNVINFVDANIKVSNTNTSHPIFQNVFERLNADFEQPSVFGYFKTKSTHATVKEDIMILANGDGLLTFTKIGNGGIYLFSAPLQPQFTDFGNMALFVPTMYNIALFSGSVPKFYHTLGSDIAISTNISEKELLKIRSLDKITEIIPEMAGTADSRILRTHSNLQLAGNYEVTSGEKVLEGISFNYSRSESEMNFLSEDEISDAVKMLGNSSITVAYNTQKPLDEYIRGQREGKPLWYIFLLLSLAMLATEICLIRFYK